MVTSKLVRVSSRGQIVLPKRLRDELGIHEGDYVSVWRTRDGFVVLQKHEDSPFWQLTEPLRREAAEQGFTREELNELIHRIRAEQHRGEYGECARPDTED